MSKRHYPTKTQDKKAKEQISYNQSIYNIIETEKQQAEIKAPFICDDNESLNIFYDWKNRFCDEWRNNTASINANNSISVLADYVMNVLSYQENATLSTDNIINNAINKYVKECLRKGGEIELKNTLTQEQANEIKEQLETRLNELDFYKKIDDFLTIAFTYGGGLMYLNTNAEEKALKTPFIEISEVRKINKIQALNVIEPYLVSTRNINTYNPLANNYMEPLSYYVNGGNSEIHSSRFLKLVVFEVPKLIKPIYNYFGLSLPQLMKESVKQDAQAKASLSDLFLRFSTKAIKTTALQTNPRQAIERAKAINSQQNNLSMLLLTPDEELIQTITPINGLDKLIAQTSENIAVSARMPVTKLLGLTPSGLNNTGQFDLISYYDEIRNIQNTKLKPIFERLLNLLLLEMGYNDIKAEYKFNELEELNELEKANKISTLANAYGLLLQNSIITQEQAFNELQSLGYLQNASYSDDLNNELDYDLEQELESTLNNETE